jgi:hypothetical protein
VDVLSKDVNPQQRDGKDLQASQGRWSAAIPAMRRRSLLIGVPISLAFWALLIWMLFG